MYLLLSVLLKTIQNAMTRRDENGSFVRSSLQYSPLIIPKLEANFARSSVRTELNYNHCPIQRLAVQWKYNYQQYIYVAYIFYEFHRYLEFMGRPFKCGNFYCPKVSKAYRRFADSSLLISPTERPNYGMNCASLVRALLF